MSDSPNEMDAMRQEMADLRKRVVDLEKWAARVAKQNLKMDELNDRLFKLIEDDVEYLLKLTKLIKEKVFASRIADFEKIKSIVGEVRPDEENPLDRKPSPPST